MAKAKVPLSRPPLPKVSDETRQISEYLFAELSSWPGVTSKPMFGLTALYRGKAIFGALPKSRAMETSSSVSFKLRSKSPAILKLLQDDSRVVTSEIELANWYSFEVNSSRDVGDALEWFARAYAQAAKLK